MERVWPGRPEPIQSFVKAVMLFRKDVEPDHKQDGKGHPNCRATMNGYRMRVAAGDMSLDEFTSLVWDRTCNLLIGETLDPAECINGVWLEDESKGGRGNVAFRLEVWFACRDDKICDAICMELHESLREATGGKNSVLNSRFTKLQHFVKKHSVRAPAAAAAAAAAAAPCRSWRPPLAAPFFFPLFFPSPPPPPPTHTHTPLPFSPSRSLSLPACTRAQSWAACPLTFPPPSLLGRL